MTDSTSAQLLARFQQGDEQAAEAIFQRYVSRLTALARSRLAPRLSRRIDPEDVVLSAYRSFFLRARRGEYALIRGGDLWRLLVAITLHKTRRQAARHAADKRDFAREQPDSPSAAYGMIDHIAGREPTPDEAAALLEEYALMMGDLSDLERQVFELRLQGLAQDEIAARIERSERTARRVLEQVRERLERRLLGPTADERSENPA
jgi:RNA polymerase sigma-70 factor (ECF subfamily)